MENEQAKPVEPEWDPAKCREGIGVLATELVRLKEVTQAQGELLLAMDLKIRTFVKAIDRLVGPPKASRGRDVAN